MEFNYFSVDESYIDNIGLKLVAGSNFRPKDIRKDFDKIIINEKMVEKLNFPSSIDAVNQEVIVDDSLRYTVIGVLQDYNHQAMVSAIEPMALMPNDEEFHMLQIKYNQQNKDETLSNLQAAWSTINPTKKIDYQYFSDEIRMFYDLLFSDLVDVVGLISFLAITIACLGLLGMATFTTETKLKEVSIRKVLGATNQNIVLQLSKGFISLLAIAIVIAIPASYYINNLWLEIMAYRVDINFGVIAFSTFILVILGILTIGSQTLRATFTNPVDTLRNE
jgi:putative ABC transport system permease protein